MRDLETNEIEVAAEQVMAGRRTDARRGDVDGGETAIGWVKSCACEDDIRAIAEGEREALDVLAEYEDWTPDYQELGLRSREAYDEGVNIGFRAQIGRAWKAITKKMHEKKKEAKYCAKVG